MVNQTSISLAIGHVINPHLITPVQCKMNVHYDYILTKNMKIDWKLYRNSAKGEITIVAVRMVRSEKETHINANT